MLQFERPLFFVKTVVTSMTWWDGAHRVKQRERGGAEGGIGLRRGRGGMGVHFPHAWKIVGIRGGMGTCATVRHDASNITFGVFVMLLREKN